MNTLKKETSETTSTLLNYEPPQHLKHKPIFMLPYEHFDGPYSDDTDAKYLSIGLAQWRDDDVESPVSAKVWRYAENSEKWSRLSEELPLHRVVDLCIFLVTALFKKNPAFAPKTFENQNEAIELKMLEAIPEGFDRTKSMLKGRLSQLYRVMKEAEIVGLYSSLNIGA